MDKTIFAKFIPMKDYYLTVTSKGCIGHCSYCMQNFLKKWEKDENLKGPFLREKPVDILLCLMNVQENYPSKLAKDTKCTYSHTVHLLQKIEKMGLVEFEKSTHHRRDISRIAYGQDDNLIPNLIIEVLGNFKGEGLLSQNSPAILGIQ